MVLPGNRLRRHLDPLVKGQGGSDRNVVVHLRLEGHGDAWRLASDFPPHVGELLFKATGGEGVQGDLLLQVQGFARMHGGLHLKGAGHVKGAQRVLDACQPDHTTRGEGDRVEGEILGSDGSHLAHHAAQEDTIRGELDENHLDETRQRVSGDAPRAEGEPEMVAIKGESSIPHFRREGKDEGRDEGALRRHLVDVNRLKRAEPQRVASRIEGEAIDDAIEGFLGLGNLACREGGYHRLCHGVDLEDFPLPEGFLFRRVEIKQGGHPEMLLVWVPCQPAGDEVSPSSEGHHVQGGDHCLRGRVDPVDGWIGDVPQGIPHVTAIECGAHPQFGLP